MQNHETNLGAGLKIFAAWASTKTFKVAVLSVLAATIAVSVTAACASYFGFCFEKGRFLQENEFIDAAIQETLHRERYTQTILKSDSVQLVSSRVIRYRDEAEFRNANPDCCTTRQATGDKGPQILFGDRLCGRAATIVAVTYRVNFVVGDQAPQSEMTELVYAVTNCGKTWIGAK